jgi:hypothetical protein
MGGPWLALEIARRLGFDSLLENLMPAGREEVPWPLMSLVLVISRLLDPSSELKIAEHGLSRSALSDLLAIPADKVNDDRLYRALDELLPLTLPSHLRILECSEDFSPPPSPTTRTNSLSLQKNHTITPSTKNTDANHSPFFHPHTQLRHLHKSPFFSTNKTNIANRSPPTTRHPGCVGKLFTDTPHWDHTAAESSASAPSAAPAKTSSRNTSSKAGNPGTPQSPCPCATGSAAQTPA